MEIKSLLVSDMDGTLLNRQQNVSAETQEAILRFIGWGGKFAIATGRALCSVSRFIRPLGIEYGILLNGALLYDFINARAIQTHPLPAEESRAFVQHILKRYPQVSVQVYGEITVGALQLNDIVTARGIREEFCPLLTPYDFLPDPWLKMTLSGPIPDILELQALAAADFQNLKLSRSSRHFCEVTGNGVHKGAGLETLAKLYGLTFKETVAVGDNENDLPMLSVAGLALAVENGSEAVRNLAAHILPDNDSHPLKHAVERICN